MRIYVCATALALVLWQPAHASETISYTYDALGRLTAVAHTGSVNSGLQSAITYDAADNRTNYTVTGGGAAPSLSIADASVTEGGGLAFTVTRAGSSAAALTVNYATANGTAVAGSDYTAASGTLSFAPNETSKTITIATTDDTVVESSETLTVTLSNPTAGATLSRATATGTIIDNDSTPVSFAIGNAGPVAEGGALIYTVTKAGTAASSFSVNYATANGTAIAGSDYNATAGTLTFAPSEISKTISVTTIDDSVSEPSETVLVNLSGATGGATISASQGSGVINDNDPIITPALSVSDASSKPDGTPLVFHVTMSTSSWQNVTVSYATSNGPTDSKLIGGTAGLDYTATSGTLSFSPGQTSIDVTVQTIARRAASQVYLNLSSPVNATIADGQGLGTSGGAMIGP